jgi:hypothetical protein
MLPPSTAVGATLGAGVGAGVTPETGVVPGTGVPGVGLVELLPQAVATSAAMAKSEAKRFISSSFRVFSVIAEGQDPAGLPGRIAPPKVRWPLPGMGAMRQLATM